MSSKINLPQEQTFPCTPMYIEVSILLDNAWVFSFLSLALQTGMAMAAWLCVNHNPRATTCGAQQSLVLSMSVKLRTLLKSPIQLFSSCISKVKMIFITPQRYYLPFPLSCSFDDTGEFSRGYRMGDSGCGCMQKQK